MLKSGPDSEECPNKLGRTAGHSDSGLNQKRAVWKPACGNQTLGPFCLNRIRNGTKSVLHTQHCDEFESLFSYMMLNMSESMYYDVLCKPQITAQCKELKHHDRIASLRRNPRRKPVSPGVPVGLRLRASSVPSVGAAHRSPDDMNRWRNRWSRSQTVHR